MLNMNFFPNDLQETYMVWAYWSHTYNGNETFGFVAKQKESHAKSEQELEQKALKPFAVQDWSGMPSLFHGLNLLSRKVYKPIMGAKGVFDATHALVSL